MSLLNWLMYGARKGKGLWPWNLYRWENEDK